MLTGKAKEDFLKWKNVPEDYLLFTPTNHMYSDIIELLDSVDIRIHVWPKYINRIHLDVYINNDIQSV